MIAFLALLLAIAPLIVLAVRNSDRDILVAIGAGGSGLAFFAAFAMLFTAAEIGISGRGAWLPGYPKHKVWLPGDPELTGPPQ
jgi:hypothetical protein